MAPDPCASQPLKPHVLNKKLTRSLAHSSQNAQIQLVPWGLCRKLSLKLTGPLTHNLRPLWVHKWCCELFRPYCKATIIVSSYDTLADSASISFFIIMHIDFMMIITSIFIRTYRCHLYNNEYENGSFSFFDGLFPHHNTCRICIHF